MGPEAHNIQFSRQIWQAVSDHAHSCLMRREFCPELSRVENLRCVDFLEESDTKYGRQIWYFEAIGVDPAGRRHVLHGALEFSIQYGLLEPAQAAMFDDEETRDRFSAPASHEMSGFFPQNANRKFMLVTVSVLFTVLAAVWSYALVNYLRSA